MKIYQPLVTKYLKSYYLLFPLCSLLILFSSCGDNKTSQKLNSGQTPKVSTPPNIIFILTDDQRFDALSYAGNNFAHTSEMDHLAKEGHHFSTALVTTPICAGSRASILTGMYERTHGYNFQSGPINPVFMEQAYPKVLNTVGYQTAFYGKFGVNYRDVDQLFDTYEIYDRNNAYDDYRGYYYKMLNGDTVHLTRYTGQKALDYLDLQKEDHPFCLSLSFSAPHAHDSAEEQYFWQEASQSILENTDIPPAPKSSDQAFEVLPKNVRDGFNRLRWTWRFDTPQKYQHSVKGYYRMIAGIDREIGKIRAKLKEKNLEQNTVLILMGDNGYFLGERQLAGKWLMYENSIRVPLIILDPRNPKNHDIHEMALNIDVPSTIAELAGAKVPEGWQGKSLVPLLNNPQATLSRDAVLIEHLWDFEHIPPSEGVRSKDWKYFRYVDDHTLEELYDLRTDPEELKNLAKDSKYQATLEELRSTFENLVQLNTRP